MEHTWFCFPFLSSFPPCFSLLALFSTLLHPGGGSENTLDPTFSICYRFYYNSSRLEYKI